MRSRTRSASAKAAATLVETNPPLEAFQQRLEIRRRWGVALLCLLTAVLWQICFAPFNLGFLAYVVLVPWGLAVAGARLDRTAIFWGWIAGLLAFGIGLYFISWVTLIGYAALILYLSVYWLLAAWAVRRAFAMRMPMWLVLPVIWVALEYARSLVISGFTWFQLADSQYRYTRLIQIADVTGTYGVSFFVAMVNGLLIDLMAQPLFARVKHPTPGHTSRLSRIMPAGMMAVACGAILLLGYGTLRLSQSQSSTAPGPRIGVVQCAFPNSLNGRDSTEEKIFYDYLAQTQKLAGSSLDLIVWPETQLPMRFNEPWYRLSPDQLADRPDLQRYLRDMQNMQGELAETLMMAKAPLLGGAATYRLREHPSLGDDPMEKVVYNSVLLLEPQPLNAPPGRSDTAPATMPSTLPVMYTVRTVGIYDKNHCVPFGEYVPFRQGWPWLHRQLRKFVPPVMEQLEPGRSVHRFTIGSGARTWTLATPICYEGLFARVCRPMVYANGQKKADILVNLSNDGWFIAQWGSGRHASTELDQHLTAYVFRAIENRVPVVRAVNCGISGFIDSSGRIQQLVEQPEMGLVKLAVDVGQREVLVDRRQSLYSLIGDLAAQLCSLSAGVVVAIILVRRRRLRRQVQGRADPAAGK